MNKTLIGGIVAAGFALAVVSGGAFAQALLRVNETAQRERGGVKIL